jgi:hypothetical protein
MNVDRTALSLERYRAIIEREAVPILAAHEAILIETMREKGRALSAIEIANLPALVEDWCGRQPDYMPAPAETLLTILRACEYPSLVALVERTEKPL